MRLKPPLSSNAKEPPYSATYISNRRLYSFTFLSFVGLLSFRGSTTFWGGRAAVVSEYREYKNANMTDQNWKYIPPMTEQPIFGPAGELRVDWTNLPVQSQLAKEIQSHQTNCKLPLRYFQPRNNAGLGSDLHVYGMAFCSAFRQNVRMFTAQPWMYWDHSVCENAIATGIVPKSVSGMSCYFPSLELQCLNDEITAQEVYNQSLHARIFNPTKWMNRIQWEHHDDQMCMGMLDRPGYRSLFKIFDYRAAMTEFQFSQVSPVVIQEAQRQHRLVFGQTGVPPAHQLITVHVRWGDKGSEMALQPIPAYIAAVEEVAARRNLQPHQVHIFLASEDPRAVTQFKQAMHPSWTVYIDQFYVEMLPHRNNRTQEVAGAAKAGFGKTGLLALGSLLVSMEADSYVLSTGSNWSRMMDELRKNIFQPRNCPTRRGVGAPENWYSGTRQVGCTVLVDVQPSFSEFETGVSRKRNSQHHMILQKLKMLQEYRRQGGEKGGHKVIMVNGKRKKFVDTKKLEKPESYAQKEAHIRRVKYPRLQKRGQYRRRRLMKFVTGKDSAG